MNGEFETSAERLDIDFWDGMTSVDGYGAVRFFDSVFYKAPHRGSWDSALTYNAMPIGRSARGGKSFPSQSLRPGDEDAGRATGRVRTLSRTLPALPRRLRGGRRADLDLPLPATIARASSSSRRPAPGTKPTRDDLRQDPPRGPPRHLDARLRGADDPPRDRAGHRLHDLPEHAGRDRAGPDRPRRDGRRERPQPPARRRDQRHRQERLQQVEGGRDARPEPAGAAGLARTARASNAVADSSSA